ncbi:MAG TPA: class I SAM-dependent methyltransferase [Candidatus Paceibacterota bacterium]|nr:class I SAM-dependent methyltransferase [Candidatus Paceibacterota bacterium]
MSIEQSQSTRAFAHPETIVSNLPIQVGTIVADLGAGTGVFTVPLARIVGDRGKVYAVEIQKELVGTLQQNANKSGRRNIEVIWGDLERHGGTKLKDASCDIAFLSNTLFLIDDKQALFKEISRILKPHGQLILMEWKDSFGGLGPAPQHMVSEEVAKTLIAGAGFSYSRSFEAGSHHYGIIFTK